MSPFKVLTSVLSLLTMHTWRVRAQAASCRDGWGWMNNTAGKDPCRIVESLDSRCFDANIEIILPKLSNISVYPPPNDTNGIEAICDCNTPMYTLFSACAACQGAGWVKWSEWSAVCGIAHVGKRPDDYLVTTPIPHWAFMNVTVNDTFVPGTAKLVGGLPEQGVDGPTKTFTPTGSSTMRNVMSTSSTSPSSSDLPSVTSTDVPKPKTPVGAIAGGTIGGLAALCLVGFGFLFIRKRGGLKIPKIRRASGRISLFDPQEGRPDPRTEEAIAMKRPLLYDPTNPATFSQVRAELERPLHHPGGGMQGSIGYYYDPYHPPQPQPPSSDNNHQYNIRIPQAH